MTIREILNRNKRRVTTVSCAAIALVLAGCLLSALSLVATIVVSLLGIAVAIVAALHGEGCAFRCPRCDGSLARLVHGNTNPFCIDRRIRYCPFCGVDIDAKDRAALAAEAAEILA